MACKESTHEARDITSSMSASFHAPGPANLARPFVPSRLLITVPHVAMTSRLMSWVARQVFATCSVQLSVSRQCPSILPTDGSAIHEELLPQRTFIKCTGRHSLTP